MSQGPTQNRSWQAAIAQLKGGHPVAMPTETVYGLAAPISNPSAIDAIFRIKARPFFDPLIVHVANRQQAKSVTAVWPALAEKLIEKFWPGPLTLVLPKHRDLNAKITSGLETVGVRCPAHPLARRLIEEVGEPLAAPSANRFGRTSPTCAEHVRNEFGDEVLVVDGGECEVGVESTVVGFNQDFTALEIYRPGSITREMLAAFAPTEVKQSPAAPGHLEHHYQPSLPLVALTSTPYLTEEIYETLCTKLQLPDLRPSWLRLPSEPVQAARTLYAELRVAAAVPFANCILLPYDVKQRNDGLHAAISDRVFKAASHCI